MSGVEWERDDALLNEVVAAIEQTGVTPGSIEVRARGGAVTLKGIVDRPELKVAVVNAAGSIEGVKTLHVQIDVDEGRPPRPTIVA